MANPLRPYLLRHSGVPALILALALSGCAPAHRSPLPASAISRETLPNGMKVVIRQQGGQAGDFVALHLWVGVGGRDERASERGYAHLVEHMLFKGTETLGPGFVEQEVEAFGGRANAGTSHDYTFYYLLLPAARTARGIELLAEMAFDARFDPVEVAREREVVFEEMRRAEDSPWGMLTRRLTQLIFPEHPYGFPVLGDPVALRDATPETLRAFYKRHYVPENMVLAVVGDIDLAEVRRTAERAFAPVPAAGHRRAHPPPAPAPFRSPHVSVQRPERQAHLGLGWAAPALGSHEMYAVDVLAQVLGGSRTSRLGQALLERGRLVSSIGASYGSLQGGGVLSVVARMDPSHLEQAETAIMAEVRRIRDEGISPQELERALALTEARHAFGTETVEGLASLYGRSETLWTLQEGLRYPERIRQVTRDEVRAAAQRYLTERYARLAFVPGQGR
jgi:zinc protease